MKSIILALLSLISFILLSKSNTLDLNNITTDGFTIELIPRYFIHPQFHPGNLTTIKNVKRRNMASVRPTMNMIGATYVVPLHIGKLKLNLALDTGSSLIWTQCSSCDPCFPQKGHKYNPAKSATYEPLPPNHPFCDHRIPDSDKCPYLMKYARGLTVGHFGWEKFHFGFRKSSLNIIFGCSTKTYGDIFPGNDEIGGVLGMGRGPESFPWQVAIELRQPNKFAYCLTKLGSSDHSTLRFGSDIEIKKPAYETPLLETNEKYYVNLIDIGIQGKRLNLRRGLFNRKPDGDGGCFFDAGSIMMHLIRPAYDAVRAKLIVYFKRFNITELGEKMPPFDLCFQTRRSFNQYPYMDLHFEGSYFRLQYSNLFHFFSGKFCLAAAPSDIFTIIGSFQQAQHQIVFDLVNEKIIFSNDNCAK